MEIFELRYFLAVAKEENMHRASERFGVSPGSLSKAIQRLEGEAGIKFFSREGRNIRLTEAGRFMQGRAAQILELEESIRLDLVGSRGSVSAVLAGPEMLLAGAGMGVVESIQKRFPRATFEFHAVEESAALRELQQGMAHLALLTLEPPAPLRSRKIADVGFQTCVGKGHPLYASAGRRKPVPIEVVLEHPFASFHRPILGRMAVKQSIDGWRDDIFPRRIAYVAPTLKVLEQLVTGGKALAYLPDHYVRTLDVKVLAISGCPYQCSQKVRVAARGHAIGWVNQII